SVSTILMRRILIHVVERFWRIVAAAIVCISRELYPSVIQFRMAFEPHACVHLQNEGVVLIQRHKVANKALEKCDIVMTGKIHIDPAKWLVGPIANLHTSNLRHALFTCE